jgi:hypothetical protein
MQLWIFPSCFFFVCLMMAMFCRNM